MDCVFAGDDVRDGTALCGCLARCGLGGFGCHCCALWLVDVVFEGEQLCTVLRGSRWEGLALVVDGLLFRRGEFRKIECGRSEISAVALKP